jgi:hypothetical protein
MENLQSKTPYNFKKSYGGTPEPLPPYTLLDIQPVHGDSKFRTIELGGTELGTLRTCGREPRARAARAIPWYDSVLHSYLFFCCGRYKNLHASCAAKSKNAPAACCSWLHGSTTAVVPALVSPAGCHSWEEAFKRARYRRWEPCR